MARRFRPPRFVRAAHYFSDGWALDSLLVMRMPRLREELRQLKNDGFNTIVVVVPWRGFQRTQNPIAYDPFYADQLRLVLAQAQRTGLAVLLRVAYTHQVMLGPSIGSIRATQGLLTDAAIETAWLDYHQTVGEIIADYPCCIGAFISWEELWLTFTHWQKLDERERRSLARASGFTDYLADRDGGGLSCIPTEDSLEHGVYHAFMNHRMTGLFEQARARFPLLGVEYRVDRDPLQTEDAVQWLENNLFLDWEPARYSYWAPFMSADNRGEALDADTALDSLRTMLVAGSDQGRCTGQILEQFNFVDDTPQYAGVHAHIAPLQLPQFLRRAAPLLKRFSAGYGLWAPRDYRCNILYNTAFLDGGRGWQLSTGTFEENTVGVTVAEGGYLMQEIEPRVAWVPKIHPFETIRLRLECRPHGNVTLKAQLNGGGWSELHQTPQGSMEAMLSVDFGCIAEGGLRFELQNLGAPVTIVRLHLFDQVYAAGVRDVDGNAGEWLRAVRGFNRRLRLPFFS